MKPQLLTPLEPVVSKFYTGPYAPAQEATGSPFTIFNSYLRLAGQNYPAGGQLRFQLFAPAASGSKDLIFVSELTPDVKVEPQGNWEAVFRVPAVAAVPAVLIAL